MATRLQAVAAAALHGDGAAGDGGAREEVASAGGVALDVCLARGLVRLAGRDLRCDTVWQGRNEVVYMSAEVVGTAMMLFPAIRAFGQSGRMAVIRWVK